MAKATKPQAPSIGSDLAAVASASVPDASTAQAARHVIDQTTKATPNDTTRTLEAGKVWGHKVRDAEGSALRLMIDAGMACAKLPELDRDAFATGYSSVWTNPDVAKARKSDMVAIVRAHLAKPKDLQTTVHDVVIGRISRAEFMATVRGLKPAEGQGARAAANPQASGAAVQTAAQKAKAAKVAAEQAKAIKQAKKKPGPALDVAAAVLPSATPEQRTAIVNATLSAVAATDGADRQMVTMLANVASRLVERTKDEALKAWAQDIASRALVMADTLDKAKGAAVPVAKAA